MAIEFNCPHCGTPYRLKDELAGKRATCKNTACRQVIVVPQPRPHTVPPSIAELGGFAPESNGKDHTPPPATPADAEAAALAALRDAAEEQAATADTVEVTCGFCDHKWTEPASKAGKNVLCPNPDCRQRVKVPPPKKGAAPTDWRTGGTNMPTLAKENFEQPTDVMNAEARVVSKEAWTEGGGAEQDLEPVALSRRLYIGSLIGVPLLLVAGGVWYGWGVRRIVQEEGVIQGALDEFAQGGAGELAPTQAPLCAAVLELAAGEFTLRQQPRVDDQAAAALKAVLDHLGKARDELRSAAQKDDARKPVAAAERNAVACELALAHLSLGGTDEQAAAGTRYHWRPEAPTGRALRMNEKAVSVYEELRRTLQLLQPADFDLKAALARRLARDLGKRGQPDLAVDLVGMLFPEPEQAEARAVVALELYRLDRASEKARQVANDLKGSVPGGRWNPIPVSAQTLWLAVETDKPPTVAAPPQPAPYPVVDTTRHAYVGLYLLQDKPQDALALATRTGGTPTGQLRALTLCAEWTPDPTTALDTAIATITSQAKLSKDAPPPPPYLVLRLAQLAAAAGRADLAKTFADTLADDGLKAWAKGDAVRLAATPENKSAIDEAATEAPDDPKKVRVGHAWGRLWTARHNARLSNDPKKETKAIAAWPKGTVHPFGVAGIALGLQDR